MFDLEREHFRKTYQLCRLAFAIIAVALVLACFSQVLMMYARFDHSVSAWIEDSFWFQWIDAPIVWGCAIGAMLLVGRWEHVSWQRRAGLFLVMNLVDVGLWFMSRADLMGPQVGEIGHAWLRHSIGIALGWGEFALLSSLSCDYLSHLGVDYAGDSDKSTRSMAATGAMVWLLSFCQRTDWRAGWPLQAMPPRPLDGILVLYGYNLIWTITLLQVTALVVSAVRQSTMVLAEFDREDETDDLLRSRSEPPRVAEGVSSDHDREHRRF